MTRNACIEIDKYADSLDIAVEAAADLVLRMRQVYHDAPAEQLRQAARVKAMVAQVLVRIGELRDMEDAS